MMTTKVDGFTKPSDDELRTFWRKAGGSFYGPHVEHGDMEEANLLLFLRSLVTAAPLLPELAEALRRLTARFESACRHAGNDEEAVKDATEADCALLARYDAAVKS